MINQKDGIAPRSLPSVGVDDVSDADFLGVATHAAGLCQAPRFGQQPADRHLFRLLPSRTRKMGKG